jgi:hypothetical protein
MPKDPTKNIDRYKVRGGTLNEYEVEQGKTAEKNQKATDMKPQKAATQKAKKKSG